MLANRLLIADLCEKIDEVLVPLTPKDTNKIGLVDFPNYPNVGDSLIALGELDWFKSRNLGISYICDIGNYNKNHLSKFVENGSIFLNGGGNFGDLWQHHQLLREKIIQDFPNNRIIQLPVTIYFSQKNTLRKCQNALDTHKNMTLLVRDNQSYEFARKEFNVDVHLCPDMAFYIGALNHNSEPTTDIAALIRRDKESNNPAVFKLPDEKCAFDWLEEPMTKQMKKHLILKKIFTSYPNKLIFLNKLLINTYFNLAQLRSRRGCNLLEKGKVVVTDRLHGHILAILLGIPHFLTDNSYGKIWNFYQCWTKNCEITYWCSPDAKPVDVLEIAIQKGWLN